VEAVARLIGSPAKGLTDPTDVFTDVPIRLSFSQYARGLLGYSSASAVRRAARVIEATVDVPSYDVVVAHGMYLLPAGTVAAELAETWHLPFTVVMHGSDVNITMAKRAKAYVHVLQQASIAIFVSDALRKKARSLGLTGGRTAVIPNGVDTQVFRPSGRRGSADPVVLFVGNLLKIKGADRLPGIFRAVARMVPDAKFVVVGDGPEQAAVEHGVRGLDATFLGRLSQTEVAAAMAMADVLVLPSRSEGWPCVILEAYACGLPVVATDVGGIPEAIDDPTLLIPDGEHVVTALARRVVEVLSAGHPSIGLRARAERYSWDELARVEENLLTQLVSGGRRADLEG
jgi:teichuronic acid biosynthesis glycosyltransferase TuaC